MRKFANKKNGDITNEQRISLFALAHGIGIFSSSGKESEIATNFILENILNNYSLAELHQKVSGWDCNGVPYNSEFAKFFIKYFKEYDLFSARNSENEENISHYLSAVHNRFREIQNVFPYKKIQTRKKNEMLTPKLIIDAISRIQYANVAENCEKFSQTIKRFGYSQKEYDILQNWYLTGLKLKENYLNVNPDGTIFNIRYELLEKSNPLCAVLGNITNCCQVVNDSGKHCLRYGMTKPNSSFVVFKQNENIIGQAWIWYDEQNRQLTLDNIEIPYSYYVKVLEKGEYKQDLLNCIERFCKNIMQKMNEEQYYVDAVTIGLGYNKIAIDLIKN